jgi:tetratricopeptide (TPR) repeat protein
MISQQRLDELWDFDDPAGSEQRLRIAAEQAAPDERPEYLTQVARALGLQERFAEGQQILDDIDESAAGPAVTVRVELEHGRLQNSAGQSERAVPHFLAAAGIAAENGLDFLRIDALHMLAITDPEREAEWTGEGLRWAEAATDDRTRRWLVSLHNNHGWTLYDRGDLEGAVAAFEQALWWAERVGTAAQQQWAREALAEVRGAQPGS